MFNSVNEHCELSIAHTPVDMAARQLPLQTSYKATPGAAWITDHAATSSRRIDPSQPLYGEVTLDGGRPTKLTYGVHKAVGGEGDYPVPGELLCAALATCLDSTIRIVANRLGLELQALEVEVAAQVDVRGTLLVDREIPVGFQKIDAMVRIDAAGGVAGRKIDMLLKAAEHSCVVLQTLRGDAQISVKRIG